MLLREVEARLAARPGAVQHLLVLLPVPIVYPKVRGAKPLWLNHTVLQQHAAATFDLRSFEFMLGASVGALSTCNLKACVVPRSIPFSAADALFHCVATAVVLLFLSAGPSD